MSEFGLCIQAYQGKTTRSVPDGVIEGVRVYLDTLPHLVQTTNDSTTRYSRVTRVHVYNILRLGSSGVRHNRWARDANHIHTRVTGQPPPNISHIQTTLTFMFGTGVFFLLLQH